MRLRRFASIDRFFEVAGGYLAAREAEHNIIFGILASVRADPLQYDGPPYLAAIIHGKRVVGAAIRTPPWRLVLAEMDHPGAVHLLVEDLAGTPLPGLLGPVEPAAHFAEAWAARTGVTARVTTHERAFRLTSVIPPRPAPGHMIQARPGDRRLVADWLRAFHDEALHGGPPQDFDRMAERYIAGIGREIYLWLDEGRVVSLTGVGGPTPNGLRVGPVYTPPAERGRGYASNLVARVSQAALDGGRRFVFLFTDLGNPTSNKIYQDIGYEPVVDVDEWAFD